MPKYILLPDAQKDLRSIHRFTTADWGREQASKYLQGLKTTFHTLADRPGLGRNRREDLLLDVMSFPYESHMIYYRLSAGSIAIIAVLHQSATPLKHLTNR